ncbi:MAG TPA: MgtC/SapB family protein [Bryobacteraceae bacterium]|nr:MgtC/SapB family protein [Bryobacteraceae bacterium]
MQPPPFHWQTLVTMFERIGLAYALTLPTAWWREKQEHAVGLRTFPIVAMASCGYLLILSDFTGSDGLAANSRVLQGLVAGIGFVGGGAIVKEGASVHGTATAASIWNTGAIGAAVALGKYEVAIVLAVLNIVTLEALVPLKKRLRKDEEGNGNGDSDRAGVSKSE